MTHTRLVLANLGRNKLRTAFTGGAITLAVLLVCILLTMPAAMDRLLEDIASDVRISVHNKAGLVYSMPGSFTRKVRNIDGVAAAVGMVWYGGAYEDGGKVTFPNFAIESEHVGAVYPDYPIEKEELADFVRYRDGAIVGAQTMDKYGWKIGDRVTLKSTIWPVDLDFRIVGRIDNPQSPHFWFSRTYLDEAMKAKLGQAAGFVGTIWVRAADPSRVNSIMLAVEEMSRNSDAEAVAETEKSFFQNFFGSLEGFIRIILLVTGLVTLCIIFIAANTASMNVRERSGEIAVLKAIGFARRFIFGSLLGEVVVLSTVAGAVGVGLALGFAGLLQSLAGGDGSLGPLGGFIITAPVLVQGLFLSLFIGMLAGVVPSFGAARKPVALALHEIF
ncbi:MAG: ABC transporter permease [Deltaproteobacteria bacterium]|nr:ABC transporter permease [Deltaproteobacteria bacterium]